MVGSPAGRLYCRCQLLRRFCSSRQDHSCCQGRPAVVLFDHPSKHFPYPLTIQNIMHFVFFIGLGELFVRWRSGGA